MTNYNQSVISLSKPTLTFSGIRAYTFQAVLIGATVILPMAMHLSGAPVRYILPMHWPVIVAGLVYGWRSGTVTGFLAPILSNAITGFPLPGILPSMTAELFMYGLVVGFLRERTSLNPLLSVAIALSAGRLVFIVSVLLGNVVPTNRLEYFQLALLPGLVAGVGQIVLLPLLSNWWVRQERRMKENDQ